MIKKQSEMFKRQQEIQQVQRVRNQQEYNFELARDGVYKAHQEEANRRLKQSELETALNNRASYDRESFEK